MKLGDRGTEVKDVQWFLIYAGFLSANFDTKGNPSIREANYGIETKKAVLDIQEFLGLRQTGIWDDQIELLYRLKLEEMGYGNDI